MSDALVRPAGVIFDLDGTLVDNMTFHQEAFDTFATRHGLPPLTLEIRRRLDGKRNRDILPILFGRALGAATVAELSDEKETLYRALSKGRLVPLPGLLELLARLGAAGIPCAVATSAPPKNVLHSLSELSIEKRFVGVAMSDEVARGKPFPDVFLAAAALLQADPALCLAFEDAPLGVAAARAAGMTCVALTTSFPAKVFLAHEPPPHHVAANYVEFLAGPGRFLARGGSP